MATPNYDIDYNDKRLVEVTDNKKAALTANDTAYNDAINGVDSKYDALIGASKEYAEEQKKNQQAQTDFAIQQIEQQKEQAKKDYTKEQSGAYVDWQKESNRYGANAEQMAASGLANSGYSESSQVSLYNTYQNRVATARDAFERSKLNFENAIQNAKLQNNSLLAEIAFNAHKEQLELALQGFQYKNQLILDKANKRLEIENMYHSQYMNVLNQINHENSLKEQVRQYNSTLDFQKDQAEKEQAYKNAQLQLQRDQFNWQKEKYEESKAIIDGGGSDEDEKKIPQRDGGTARIAYQVRGFTGSTYKEANEYLKKNGVSDFNLMTKAEWQRRKSSYNRTGVGGVEVSAYGTYAAYLASVCKYAIANK